MDVHGQLNPNGPHVVARYKVVVKEIPTNKEDIVKNVGIQLQVIKTESSKASAMRNHATTIRDSYCDMMVVIDATKKSIVWLWLSIKAIELFDLMRKMEDELSQDKHFQDEPLGVAERVRLLISMEPKIQLEVSKHNQDVPTMLLNVTA